MRPRVCSTLSHCKPGIQLFLNPKPPLRNPAFLVINGSCIEFRWIYWFDRWWDSKSSLISWFSDLVSAVSSAASLSMGLLFPREEGLPVPLEQFPPASSSFPLRHNFHRSCTDSSFSIWTLLFLSSHRWSSRPNIHQSLQSFLRLLWASPYSSKHIPPFLDTRDQWLPPSCQWQWAASGNLRSVWMTLCRHPLLGRVKPKTKLEFVLLLLLLPCYLHDPHEACDQLKPLDLSSHI